MPNGVDPTAMVAVSAERQDGRTTPATVDTILQRSGNRPHPPLP